VRIRLDHAGLWHLLLIATFAIGSARSLLFILLEPEILGSHGVIYTAAARAWLTGGDPWSVGPPAVLFAGPPPMLLPFVPFVPLPDEATRWLSVIAAGALAYLAVRRLRLPLYWLLFPPVFGSVLLGHPEVLVLALLVAGGVLSGLAAVIKPYAGLALLAERRWAAIVLGLAVVGLTVLVLPWARFIDELPAIAANLARQAQGESTFGNPLLMAVAVVALARLGVRRALWLATPLLWPAAQPGYRAMTVPALSPLIAAAWALPIPGLTLGGIVLEAVALEVGRRRPLPRFVQLGIAVDGERPATDAPAEAIAPAATTPLANR
jgi:hypothetical protein